MRLLRKGGVFGQDVFLNEDGESRRGHNANALSHAMILSVPGEKLHELLRQPENIIVRQRVRLRLCFETLRTY
jgi:CRP-like cAMP-binding protein